MKIYLEFSPEQTAAHRARLGYAFRLFCAIYGHEPVLQLEEAASAEVWIRYVHEPAPPAGRPCLVLSNLYRPRSPREPAPSPRGFARDGEATVLFYMPYPDQQPDWLGEIFEWVSCADEYSVTARDTVGRTPSEATYAGRNNLDVRVPYAAIAMRLLALALQRRAPEARPEPLSPVVSARHFIVPTHDVDYFPTSRVDGTLRLAKNAVISSLLARRPALGLQQVRMALAVAAGAPDPMDKIPDLVEGERARGVPASYYFLVRHRHRRDANYSLERPEVADCLRSLEAQGMEVGVHTSYTCLDEPRGPEEEFNRLRNAGVHPRGMRQHWLRFRLERLIPALERTGVLYDTSLGWSDRIGFRAGACFAFPPYNFDEERPARFLEIPLVIMDQALQATEGADHFRAASELLASSRRYGWGGVSLLWHPAAFGGGWLEREIGETYWRLVDSRLEYGDTWVSAAAFVESVRRRYVNAGLLPAHHETDIMTAPAPESGQREQADDASMFAQAQSS